MCRYIGICQFQILEIHENLLDSTKLYIFEQNYQKQTNYSVRRDFLRQPPSVSRWYRYRTLGITQSVPVSFIDLSTVIF